MKKLKMHRPDQRLEREEYLSRARDFAVRGQDLPQAKLDDDKVLSIKSASKQRELMRKYIRDNLSNNALAQQFGVHVKTIEKVLQNNTWNHVK
jgi:hypothetical protein